MKKMDGKIRILYFLLKRIEPAAMKVLTECIGRSERTVRTYLEEIKREYPEVGLRRKGKTGVWLEADSAARERVLSRLSACKDLARLTLERRQRHWYILRTLFLERYTYTIQLFADELYCSKSTIIQDLAWVARWAAQKKLRLCKRQNQGIWLAGAEKDLRLAFKDLLDETRQAAGGETLPTDAGRLDYRMDLANYSRVAKLLPKVDLLLIQGIVQEAEQALKFYFTEQAFWNLVVHLAIAVKRMEEGKFLEDIELSDAFKATAEYGAARRMIQKLEEGLRLKFTEAEIAYAAVHMLGAKVQADESGFSADAVISHYGEEEVSLAKEVIAIASAVLGVNFIGDEKLLIRLVQHLRPTIVRMRQGLRLYNPMLDAIKREYAAAFAAAWAAGSAFERVVGLPLSEDEVAYIALHFIAGMEERRKKYRAIVVCASGIGTSQLLVSKLARHFPDLEILTLLPYHKLTPDMGARADVIISTVALPENAKTVCVSALLTAEDRDGIRRFLRRAPNAWAGEASARPAKAAREVKREILMPAFCFLDDDSPDFTALIRKYGDLLERAGFAKEGFAEDVMRRETVGSTYIGHGICIPHSKASFVRRSRIVFIRLRKPVLVRQESVSIVLLLCLNFGDARSTVYFFKNLYAVLSDASSVRALHEEKSRERIAAILNGGREHARVDHIGNDCAGRGGADEGGSDSAAG